MIVLDPNVLPDLMRTEANHQAFQAEINQLARIILEGCGSSADRERASRVAEAQIELYRVRRACQLITRAHQKAQVVADEHRALIENHDWISARKRNASRDIQKSTLGKPAGVTPSNHTFESIARYEAGNLSDMANQPATLDRHVKRAFSQRKLAIRAFNQLAPWH